MTNNINMNNYISEDFTTFYQSKCKNEDQKKKSIACSISFDKIDEISHFIAHEITRCKEIDITLDDLKDGKVLAKGGFGYSYITSLNNSSRKKIIKIIICPDLDDMVKNEDIKKVKEDMDKIKYEIELHSQLVNSGYNIFIKLIGYFLRNEQNIYEYYENNNNFNKVICDTQPSVNNNFTKGCEIYMILEAGYGDLTKYMDDQIVQHHGLEKSLSINKKYTVDTLLELVNFYKVSDYFLKEYNKVFLHNDLKIENIVYLSDTKFKIIDFGLSQLTDKFFVFNNIGGTDFTYSMLYDIPELKTKLSKYPNRGRIKSPFYDMFCMCIAIFEFICYHTLDLIDNNSNLYQKLWRVKEIVEKYNFTNEMRTFINNLIQLTTAIYDFQQKNIKILLSSGDYDEYKEVNNIEYFVVPFIFDKKPPSYEKNSDNKLVNDFNYFDRIVQYYLNLPRC